MREFLRIPIEDWNIRTLSKKVLIQEIDLVKLHSLKNPTLKRKLLILKGKVNTGKAVK
jgi:hypothetical protein